MKKILQVFLPALMAACLSVACAEKVLVDEVPPHFLLTNIIMTKLIAVR